MQRARPWNNSHLLSIIKSVEPDGKFNLREKKYFSPVERWIASCVRPSSLISRTTNPSIVQLTPWLIAGTNRSDYLARFNVEFSVESTYRPAPPRMYNQLGLRDNTVASESKFSRFITMLGFVSWQPAIRHVYLSRCFFFFFFFLSISLSLSLSFPREMDDVCTCEQRRAREERDGSYRFVINSRVCNRARPLSPRDLQFSLSLSLSRPRQSPERISRILFIPRAVNDRGSRSSVRRNVTKYSSVFFFFSFFA